MTADTFRLLSSTVLVLLVSLAPGCADESSPPLVDDTPGLSLILTPDPELPAADAGAPEATPDAGCGLSFDEALEAFAPERVCQTTVYRRDSGYCTHWVACSSL